VAWLVPAEANKPSQSVSWPNQRIVGHIIVSSVHGLAGTSRSKHTKHNQVS